MQRHTAKCPALSSNLHNLTLVNNSGGVDWLEFFELFFHTEQALFCLSLFYQSKVALKSYSKSISAMKKIAIAAMLLMMGTATTVCGQWQKPAGLVPIEIKNFVQFTTLVQRMDIDEITVTEKLGRSTKLKHTSFSWSYVSVESSQDGITAELSMRVSNVDQKNNLHSAEIFMGKTEKMALDYDGEHYLLQPELNFNPDGLGRVMVGTTGKKTIKLVLRLRIPVSTGEQFLNWLKKAEFQKLVKLDTIGNEISSMMLSGTMDTLVTFEQPRGWDQGLVTEFERITGAQKFKFEHHNFGARGYQPFLYVNGEDRNLFWVDEQVIQVGNYKIYYTQKP